MLATDSSMPFSSVAIDDDDNDYDDNDDGDDDGGDDDYDDNDDGDDDDDYTRHLNLILLQLLAVITAVRTVTGLR